MKLRLLLPTILLLFAGLAASPTASAQLPILEELDKTIDLSEGFVQNRLARIKNIRNLLDDPNISLQQQYNTYTMLYKEYRSFQFDNAMQMLNERERVARELKDRSLIAEVNIDRALLYTTSGMFFEASKLLDSGIDTLHLNRDQRVKYYSAQHRFHSDFMHYTSDQDVKMRAGYKMMYYRERILESTTPDETVHQYIIVRNHMSSGRWEDAEKISRALLSSFKPDEHEYAMYSYDLGRICEALERRDEMVEWFARSAMADMRSATKDNASLCSLAQNLLERDEIDRAFRYITISLNDALYYNAKLRPWQISGVIPDIERAYHAKQTLQREEIEREQERSRLFIIIISILAIVLFGGCCYMASLLVRSGRDARRIREMNEHIGHSNEELQRLNERLEAMNSELREANIVKEEYIGLFLSMCSDYIEKLTTMQRNVRRKLSQGKAAELERELSSSSLMDEELDNFYEMFDNAFLSLYPRFVEEFNALLRPDAHIELKKGEKLNTELRIFALIRLGITDSSRIASLLRYSVNTIYNYRARTKNNALDDRSSFEERIKIIGK